MLSSSFFVKLILRSNRGKMGEARISAFGPILTAVLPRGFVWQGKNCLAESSPDSYRDLITFLPEKKVIGNKKTI
jgi:hypothetical protein